MFKLAIMLLVLSISALTSHARFDDTPAQLEERFGNSITNLPGFADVAGVAVYSKNDLFITVFFMYPNGQHKGTSKAQLIFYTRAKPFSGFSIASDLAPNEIRTVLETVKGRWEGTDPQNVNSSSSIGILDARQGAIAKMLQEAMRIIYPHEYTYTPLSMCHNGSKIFAFHIIHGVTICSSDAVDGLLSWAGHIKNMKTEPSPKKLSGL